MHCRSCSVGEVLHLGACLGTHLHVKMEAATLNTMSRVKAATTELSAVWTEVECLKAENARLQKDWPKQAAEID